MKVNNFIAGSIFFLVGVPASAATISVFGLTFDTENATTTASITGGGYATAHGPALFSGGSDDWAPPNAAGDSLGTHFLLPTFQPGYDSDNETRGNVGSSVTLGGTPNSVLTNARDVIRTRWDQGYGLANDSGNDLAVFEKATSEAFAIRVHSATTLSWTPWYFEIFNQPEAGDFGTATVYDLSHFGIASDDIINAIEITNLTPQDTVATSTGEFDGTIELGFGVVTLGGATSGYSPARRRTAPNSELKRFELGKHDPDIMYVVGLTDIDPLLDDVVTEPANGPEPAIVPIPATLFLILPALAFLGLSGRRNA